MAIEGLRKARLVPGGNRGDWQGECRVAIEGLARQGECRVAIEGFGKMSAGRRVAIEGLATKAR